MREKQRATQRAGTATVTQNRMNRQQELEEAAPYGGINAPLAGAQMNPAAQQDMFGPEDASTQRQKQEHFPASDLD
ncbi:hypothetical protein, partial [Helicobacter pylori]|uniref:hypothetical protein n=1 Tax=Helicobacter pylori TaxID=210 RepID=UPI002928F52B